MNWKELRTTICTAICELSPDGQGWVYVKGRDVYSRPLPAGTGPDRLLTRLAAEPERVWVSYDRLVLADQSGQIHAWAFLEEGLEHSVILRPDTAPSGLLVDPSQRWFAGDPYEEEHARFWDLKAWRDARPTPLRRSGSWYGAKAHFHPEGSWIVASTGGMANLTFWPLVRTPPAVVEGYKAIVRPLAFSPDGEWLATGWGEEGRLRLWPLPGNTERAVVTVEFPEAFLVTTLRFDPKSRYVFVTGLGDSGGLVWIVPLDDPTPRRLHPSFEGTMLHGAAISPSGRFVATAYGYGQGERVLRVWEVETGAYRSFELPETSSSGAPTGYERGISSMAFANESTLYTAGDGGLRRWNLESGSHELMAVAPPGFRMGAKFLPALGIALVRDNRLGGERRPEDCTRAFVHDLRTGSSRTLTRFGECGSWGVGAFDLDSSGAVVATGDRDGHVRVGQLSGGPPHLLLGHRGPVASVAISPDLRWIATTGDDNTLRLWPMPDLSKPALHTLPYEEILARLRRLTNLRVVRDAVSGEDYRVEVGEFPGWAEIPDW